MIIKLWTIHTNLLKDFILFSNHYQTFLFELLEEGRFFFFWGLGPSRFGCSSLTNPY